MEVSHLYHISSRETSQKLSLNTSPLGLYRRYTYNRERHLRRQEVGGTVASPDHFVIGVILTKPLAFVLFKLHMDTKI